MSELETPPPPEQPPSTPPSGGGPDAPQDPNIILPENAKDPVVILIVALFFGPIGYFVMNQWQKGLKWSPVPMSMSTWMPRSLSQKQRSIARGAHSGFCFPLVQLFYSWA